LSVRVDTIGGVRYPIVVPVSTRERLPIEAVRDLLGICRAMYAAARAEGAGDVATGLTERRFHQITGAPGASAITGEWC
jgi:hypothetical protein